MPLGSPRALTVGLEGVEGVEGRTEDRKLEAGDCGLEVKGEEQSEWAGEKAGPEETGGGGGGGGGGKSWAGPEGEERLLGLRKGGGGGGKEGELGESRLLALLKGGRVTLLKGLCEEVGERGEGRLEPEDPED